MKINKEAEQYLKEKLLWVRLDGNMDAKQVISTLIEGGFMEEEVLTKPEQYAQKAREWVNKIRPRSAKDIWEYVSCWDTRDWELVLALSIPDLEYRKNISEALIILAVDAGIVSRN